MEEREAVFAIVDVPCERPRVTCEPTVRWLHFDDIRPQIGQKPGRVLAVGLRQIQHSEVAQRQRFACHATSKSTVGRLPHLTAANRGLADE